VFFIIHNIQNMFNMTSYHFVLRHQSITFDKRKIIFFSFKIFFFSLRLRLMLLVLIQMLKKKHFPEKKNFSQICEQCNCGNALRENNDTFSWCFFTPHPALLFLVLWKYCVHILL
jgi:hypothetical protein